MTKIKRGLVVPFFCFALDHHKTGRDKEAIAIESGVV
jgi:hypothetical protein